MLCNRSPRYIRHSKDCRMRSQHGRVINDHCNHKTDQMERTSQEVFKINCASYS